MSEPDVPEFYVDQFRVTANAYGLALTFGLTPPHPQQAQPVIPRDLVRLRMSLEHAKIMVMILKRQLRAYEQETGLPINIPHAVYHGLGLSSEDW